MRVLSALATVLISVVIGFGLFEVYTRIFETDGQNFDIEMWRYAKDLKRVSDIPGMGHEHVPGTEGVYMGVPVKINSVGWRDDEHPIEKPAATTRIMMLGDSLTFGWGVPADGVTSNILEQRLNGAAADGGVEAHGVVVVTCEFRAPVPWAFVPDAQHGIIRRDEDAPGCGDRRFAVAYSSVNEPTVVIRVELA